MRIGDEIEIEPSELVAGGAALARVDGLPIFVMSTYPGDRALVRITEMKKGFARAELVSIVTPSDLRRAQPCPIAGECGGCDWTALRLDAQLRAKERILRESLRRIGKFPSIPPITLHPSPLNYRLRSRLHRDGDAVGFYAMRSNRVVPLAVECEVVGIETAKLYGGQAPSPVQAVGTGEGACPPLESWEIDGRIVTHGELTIHGYVVGTDSFFQVNRHLLDTMLRLVGNLASKSSGTAIDLYAGVGFFSVSLAKIFERVIAVEGSRSSFEYAKRNVPSNVELVHAPVQSFDIPKASFIFLDPPRVGAQRNVIEAIAAQATEMICFLACDPVTFSRDASRLTASGWRLATLDLLDLFPNTHHVETLASFERAS
jgi:tRNA/tmRNA/rRNA uracil-C5-methylase (TrmA/RlmC/RlmD family)